MEGFTDGSAPNCLQKRFATFPATVPPKELTFPPATFA
jgi:hypothetical protein